MQLRVYTWVCKLPNLPTREKTKTKTIQRLGPWEESGAEEGLFEFLFPPTPLGQNSPDWVLWTHEAGGFLEEVEFSQMK